MPESEFLTAEELAEITGYKHQGSQKEWLDASQGMGSYTDSMVRMASDLGHRSGIFSHAAA